MTRSSWVVSSVVLFAAALWISGCGSSSTDPSAKAPKDDQENGDDDHGAHGHGKHGQSDAEKIAAQLAKLSPEDRAAAEKQKNCPVTRDLLGSMGVPLKVKVQGQELFLCCKGCEKKLKNNPKKYLQKLAN